MGTSKTIPNQKATTESSTLVLDGAVDFSPPNWEDPTKYPSPVSKDFKRWAWEFLRRNVEYGELARKAIMLEPQVLSRRRKPRDTDLLGDFVAQSAPPADSCKTIKDYREWCQKNNQKVHLLTWRQFMKQKWGVDTPLHPKFKLYEKNGEGNNKRKVARLRFVSNTVTYLAPDCFGVEKDGENELAEHSTSYKRIALQENEVWVRFRLNESINHQIKLSENKLQKWQAKYIRLVKDTNVPATGYRPEKLKEKLKSDSFSAASLYYALRIYDAVHVVPGKCRKKFDSVLIKKLVRHFNAEKNSLNNPHQLPEDYDLPVFRASQIEAWYKAASQYVLHHGYLRVAGYKPPLKK